MSKHKPTDIAIIGGGLTGLTLAALLEQEGLDYLLIEGQNEFGGLAKGQLEQGVWLDYGMKSIPVGDEISSNPLLVLKKKLDLDINIESWTDTPQTLEKSGLAPFMGFGETKARSLVEELNYYVQSPRLMVSGGWKNLTNALLAKIPEAKRLSRAIITRIDLSEECVTGLQLNGETLLDVKRVLFTLPPDHLKGLVATGHISPKLAQRIGRSTPLTALSLDIATKNRVSDAKNIFIFKDASEDDFYVLGQFISNADPSRNVANLQVSSWLTLVDSELALDDEYVSKAIKMMKKNIKKAFAGLFDQSAWERLLVVPNALSQFDQVPIEKGGNLQGFTNLFLAGGQSKGASKNISNALQSAMDQASRLSSTTSNLARPADINDLSV